jgi:hypothetical protein
MEVVVRVFNIGPDCDQSYPNVCIPSPPPELTYEEFKYRNLHVTGSAPLGIDENNNG